MAAPARDLRALGRVHHLGARPWLMGIVNATPDSFSDAGGSRSVDERVALAADLIEAGADVIDVGGESGVTNRPPVGAEEEIARVVPVIERVAGELGALVSVDTYKPAVADAAIAAGAAIVNDVSGLRDPALATVCARTGAALVLMHTRVAPKQKLENPVYDDVAGDVEAFLRDLVGKAVERGVTEEQLLLDPGPDFAKTPAQTVSALQGMDRLHALGRPLLLALSRKDFVGAITGRPPRERLAGTLAAVGWGWRAGGHVFRVHDVAAAREALTVQRVLDGEVALDAGLRLAEELRRQGPDD
jgi:dihydropteroate synthase